MSTQIIKGVTLNAPITTADEQARRNIDSVIDAHAGPFWGDKAIKYNGRYVQIFKFVNGKVKSFEEYYDTALLNSVYGG